MTAPTREQREEWRKRAEFWATRDPSTIGHLYDHQAVEFAKELVDALDALDAAEERAEDLEADLLSGNACGAVGCRALSERDEALERLAAVRALANGWANQPTDYDDDTEQQIEDGRMLLAALDGRKRDHWEDS